MGCVDMPAQKQQGYAQVLHDVRFVTVLWLHASCPKTDKTKPSAQIKAVLSAYYDCALRFATVIAIEKQHKWNGKMKNMATAIRSFFKDRGHKRIFYRPAWEKFWRVVWLPTPMPKEKRDRKNAAERAINDVLAYELERKSANAEHMRTFYDSLRIQRHDVCDAFLIGMDWLLRDPKILKRVARNTDAFMHMFNIIAARTRSNRRKKKRKPDRVFQYNEYTQSSSSQHRRFYDELDINDLERQHLSLHILPPDKDDARKKRKPNNSFTPWE